MHLTKQWIAVDARKPRTTTRSAPKRPALSSDSEDDREDNIEDETTDGSLAVSQLL